MANNQNQGQSQQNRPNQTTNQKDQNRELNQDKQNRTEQDREQKEPTSRTSQSEMTSSSQRTKTTGQLNEDREDDLQDDGRNPQAKQNQPGNKNAQQQNLKTNQKDSTDRRSH